MNLDRSDPPGTSPPRPGAAPLSRWGLALARLETLLLLRNGDLLLLGVVIPLIACLPFCLKSWSVAGGSRLAAEELVEPQPGDP